ncbi:hypothetical protein J6590_024231 [Homalodisca vitripennis]|nr:hypothetical protein J6590_024231 [Homalodisca vitripennis]
MEVGDVRNGACAEDRRLEPRQCCARRRPGNWTCEKRWSCSPIHSAGKYWNFECIRIHEFVAKHVRHFIWWIGEGKFLTPAPIPVMYGPLFRPRKLSESSERIKEIPKYTFLPKEAELNYTENLTAELTEFIPLPVNLW